MASISRFDKFSPRDYTMNWVVPTEFKPNFEAWDSALAGLQKNYDITKTFLQEKNPNYLQTDYDRELFQQYKQQADQSVTDISKAYQEQGVTAGKKLTR